MTMPTMNNTTSYTVDADMDSMRKRHLPIEEDMEFGRNNNDNDNNNDDTASMDQEGLPPVLMMTEDDDADDDMMQAFFEESEQHAGNGNGNGGGMLTDAATEQALRQVVGDGTAATSTGNTIRQVSDSTRSTDVSAQSGSRTGTGTGDGTNTSTSTGTAFPTTLHLVDAANAANAAAAAAANVDGTQQSQTTKVATTGRPSVPLYLSCNPDYLSEYQCLIRKSVELFEASSNEIQQPIKGRNKPIVLGQVGIRCRHCSSGGNAHYGGDDTAAAAAAAAAIRTKGSRFYPHTLVGIYQAAQIISQQHLLDACPRIPPEARQALADSKTKKSQATVGKEYWAQTAKVLGVYEDQYGLRFESRIGIIRHLEPH